MGLIIVEVGDRVVPGAARAIAQMAMIMSGLACTDAARHAARSLLDEMRIVLYGLLMAVGETALQERGRLDGETKTDRALG